MIGSPDLLVEALSPGNAAHERELKLRLYERAGVGEYWIVDPNQHTVERYTLGADRTYGEPTLHGDAVDLVLDDVTAHVDLRQVWAALA